MGSPGGGRDDGLVLRSVRSIIAKVAASSTSDRLLIYSTCGVRFVLFATALPLLMALSLGTIKATIVGRVAQLVRALLSHSRGPGFESLRVHQQPISDSADRSPPPRL